MIKTHIFYKTICNVNQKYYYGVHCLNGSIEEDDYLGSGIDLKKDIQKYGKGKFTRIVIMQSIDKELVDLAEAYYVTESVIQDTQCYNRALGGTDLNYSNTQSMRNMLSKKEFVTKHFSTRLFIEDETPKTKDMTAVVDRINTSVNVFVSPKKKSNRNILNTISKTKKLSLEEAIEHRTEEIQKKEESIGRMMVKQKKRLLVESIDKCISDIERYTTIIRNKKKECDKLLSELESWK